MGQVSVQYGGPTAKLVVDQDIRAPWLAKRRGVFSLIINIRIVRSLQVGTWDVTEGMSSYSPHLAKNNKHVGESHSCRMRVKGHGRGLRRLGVKKVIIKGLLVSQGLNLVISCVGPVIDFSGSLPDVPCPKRKKLEASHRKLGDLVSQSIPFWLPHGMAELLDDVVGEVSEYIQGRNHLVIVEGFCRSLAEKKDLLVHVNGGLADPCLKGSSFCLRVSPIVTVIFIFVLDGQFVRVNASLALGLSYSSWASN